MRHYLIKSIILHTVISQSIKMLFEKIVKICLLLGIRNHCGTESENLTYTTEPWENQTIYTLTDLEGRKTVNPYNYSFVLQSTPCLSHTQLVIVVHSSTKVSIK